MTKNRISLENAAATMLLLALTLAPLWAADPDAAPSAKVTAIAATSTNAAPKEPTVVTSERLQVDYAHNVGTFTGNVLAVDPQITLRADVMVAFFAEGGASTNRSLSKIIATGAVIINQENRKATCEHAVYTTADGKAVLTIHPKVQSADGTVTGEIITLWRESQKMDVVSGITETNRTRLIFFPQDNKTNAPPKSVTPPPTPTAPTK